MSIVAVVRLVLLALFFTAIATRGACSGCASFEPGVSVGRVLWNGLSEASGIAASRRNYTVLWTHNDGSQGNLYAITTNGARLATFDLGRSVEDIEDIAVGPGPDAGRSYLYVGDIGGANGTNGLRPSIRILRVPEPAIDLAWATNARSLDFTGVDMFTLTYPDGSYDAETLMVDPLNGDVWIGTKQNSGTRLYRANVHAATNRQTLTLEFVRAIAFENASGGDISPDGTEIVIRRENAAHVWQRCDAEPLGEALSRTGATAPVIGPPAEPNGEGIAFLADASGYVTISESNNPTLYQFRATCLRAPRFMVLPTNQNVFQGGSVTFRVAAAGNPAPSYLWRFGGEVVAGASGNTLIISNVTTEKAGVYSVVASNSSGSVTSSVTLVVRPKPVLRITEVMASPSSPAGVATADWWELTSFEDEPVSLEGWRFNDSSGGLADPFRITNAIVIQPGESIVLVEGLSRAQFFNWWGSTNLPANMQVVTYSGNGLGFGAGGDSIHLWDNATVDANDPIASVTFGTATTGVSFGYDPVVEQFGAMSQAGVNGAVRASSGNDVGSPGRIRAPAVPPVLRGSLQEDSLVIQFMAAAGHRYSLEVRQDLSGAEWSPTGDVVEATTNGVLSFTKVRGAHARFYRVVVE